VTDENALEVLAAALRNLSPDDRARLAGMLGTTEADAKERGTP
jgi:hypothetical protein